MFEDGDVCAVGAKRRSRIVGKKCFIALQPLQMARLLSRFRHKHTVLTSAPGAHYS